MTRMRAVNVHVEEVLLCVSLKVSVAVPQPLLSSSTPHLTDRKNTLIETFSFSLPVCPVGCQEISRNSPSRR